MSVDSKNKSGICFVCGRYLGWYWTKYIHLYSDKIACTDHFDCQKHPELYNSVDEYVFYSDG